MMVGLTARGVNTDCIPDSDFDIACFENRRPVSDSLRLRAFEVSLKAYRKGAKAAKGLQEIHFHASPGAPQAHERLLRK